MATALLEKPEVTEQEDKQPETSDGVTPYHWTVERFYRAAQANVFDDPGRLELVHGRILEKMPTGPLHTTVSYDIAERLRAAAGLDFLVREERAIHLAFDGEPIPDIALVRGRSPDYRKNHPAPENVALLVEVSVSSIDYDLGEKALLYAKVGIEDYWVVMPEAQEIVMHRQPSAEGYGEVTRLVGAEALSPLAMPEVDWTVDALLGREEE